MNEACVGYLDDNDPYGESRQILLATHALIDGHQHVERRGAALEQFAILECRPTLFLSGPNEELRQITPELSRHVLIEQDPFHAICAKAARLASSRKPTACSRETLG
jgi:hypothetical protein